MAHLYKVEEWNVAGTWYCNDIKDLTGISGKWWVAARLLNISLTDYILLLKDKFNATIGTYNPNTDYLHIEWKNYTDCHKYVLFINKRAREKNFMV